MSSKMVCIGTPHFFKFLSTPGCGEKWDRDFPDGKCPICRGFLIPESMVGPQHKIVGKAADNLPFGPDDVEAARVGGSATQLLRTDATWLGEMLIEVFGKDGALPATPFVTRDMLQAAYPLVTFEPTDECWAAAVAIFEARLDDEAREIVESIDPEAEGDD